ncbi:MAG: IS3 family transposase [Peptostreptococcaceae bacterium]|nr:IS3 family transposase [Peptostreptococcaceae bacterium]
MYRYTFDTRNQANVAIEAFIFFYNYFRINLKAELTHYEVQNVG